MNSIPKFLVLIQMLAVLAYAVQTPQVFAAAPDPVAESHHHTADHATPAHHPLHAGKRLVVGMTPMLASLNVPGEGPSVPDEHPCCSLTGGMCVTLISTSVAVDVPARQASPPSTCSQAINGADPLAITHPPKVFG